MVSDFSQARNEPGAWKPVATVLVSGVAGPLIGLVLLLTGLGVMGGVEKANSNGLLLPFLALNPLMWLLAYFLVGIPAVLAGIAYTVLDRYLPPSVPRVVLAMTTGLVVMVGYWLYVAGGSGSMWLLAGVGAATGSVIAWLTRRWRYRHDA